MASWKRLGELARSSRERKGLARHEVAAKLEPFVDDADLRKLEGGGKLAPDGVLAVARFLGIPEKHWRPLISTDSDARRDFEEVLSELVGQPATLDHLDRSAAAAADRVLTSLMKPPLAGAPPPTPQQVLDLFNRLLVFYGFPLVSREFFDHYLTPAAFSSIDNFLQHVERYQIDAIRLFTTLEEGYRRLCAASSLATMLRPLASRDERHYKNRTPWTSINEIEEARLADLGYISAAQVRRERNERQALHDFLIELADKIEESGVGALSGGDFSQTKLRKMDSLLRKFSSLHHGFLSPLFLPDADSLRREAATVGPKDEHDLTRIEETQAIALGNLANYLTADYMDVYVATSMRSVADFVSVNRFSTALFQETAAAGYYLRHFNPTQSWIEDRVAKGLVEALMLRRANITIYMAQKEDTFGKDSEASVALGQGKPVIVYVPRLFIPDLNIDSASLGLKSRNDLEALIRDEAVLPEDKETDVLMDEQALMGRLLLIRLAQATPVHFAEIAREHWADFDLRGEEGRIPMNLRPMFREWLDNIILKKLDTGLPPSLHDPYRRLLVGITINFEKRAQMFRVVHPLALQVILSSGVLNGMLVARSVSSCADLLVALIRNELSLKLQIDEHNYRVVEANTGSTIRVISRHKLLSDAFTTFYGQSALGITDVD
jgi:hypothetical protein